MSSLCKTQIVAVDDELEAISGSFKNKATGLSPKKLEDADDLCPTETKRRRRNLVFPVSGSVVHSAVDDRMKEREKTSEGTEQETPSH